MAQRNILFFVIFCLCYSASISVDNVDHRLYRPGIQCAGCTFAVGVLEQLSQIHNESVADSMSQLCAMLPKEEYRLACKTLIILFSPIIIDVLYRKGTPDIVCQLLYFCPRKSSCHLFPVPKEGLETKLSTLEHLVAKHLEKYQATLQFDVCLIPGVKFICDLLEKSFEHHVPMWDIDHDQFSPGDLLKCDKRMQYVRGSAWRGRDCNDYNRDIHPGRRPLHSDRELDSNCNGIGGTDENGTPYEDLLCADSEPQGFAIIGDSVGAHFHIPEEWVWVEKLNETTAAYISFVLEHEGDWPMTSAATGYENLTIPVIAGFTSSVYLQMRKRNRCNHRDYQNLSVNGARSGNIDRAMHSLFRNISTDYPLLVTYGLFGNDVCSSSANTSDMTSPENMQKNVLKTFNYLNASVPKGSHVILLGLADGTVLYDALHERYHPIGRVNKDVKYPDFYDYFNCLKISPCAGWLNTNEEIRLATTKRANELSDVLKGLAEKYHSYYENFDIYYIPCPLTAVIEEFKKKYGLDSAWQLLEPVDGFHPNQFGEALAANYLFNYLSENVPQILGKINPYNDRIIQLFQEQGGH